MKAIKVAFGVVILGVIGLVVWLAAGHKEKQENPGAKPVDKIVVGMQQEPSSLFPRMGGMFAQTEMHYLLFSPLLKLGDKWDIGALQPHACEEVPTVENGGVKITQDADGETVGMVVTWKLRKDCKWSDGKPVTAHDYIFAFDVIMHDEVKVTGRDDEQKVERMEAPDDHTLVVHWKEPYAYANCFGLSAHPAMPKHLLEKAFNDNPKELHNHVYARKPVGNGPYVLDEWKPGASLTFSPNPHWFGPKPKIKNIKYRIISGTQTLTADLEAGAIDAISPIGLSAQEILQLKARLEKNNNTKYETQFRLGLVWEHIDMNMDNPILKDKRVRHALAFAIDREELVRVLFEGKQPVSHSWLPPKHFGYDSNVKKYTHDPKKAADLFDAAGWKLDEKSGWRKKDGNELELEFMTTKDNRTRERVQEILQAQWKAVGVRVLIVNQPASVYFGKTTRQRLFKHLAMYAWVFSPTSHGQGAWSEDKIPTKDNGWNGSNYPGLRNKEITELHKQIPRTLPLDKRRELFRRQQQLWVDELPSIPLYFRATVTATRADLRAWRPTGHSNPVTWNAHEWHFAPKAEK